MSIIPFDLARALATRDYAAAMNCARTLPTNTLTRALAYEDTFENREFLAYVLQHGNVNLYCKSDPYFYVALQTTHNIESVPLILKNANIDLLTKGGGGLFRYLLCYTSWSIQSSSYKYEVLQAVWRAGVDPRLMSESGRDARGFAATYGRSPVLQYVTSVYNREVVFHFCGSKVFALPDDFLHLLSDIFQSQNV